MFTDIQMHEFYFLSLCLMFSDIQSNPIQNFQENFWPGKNEKHTCTVFDIFETF